MGWSCPATSSRVGCIGLKIGKGGQKVIIDIHTHLFAEGWIPPAFFHGIARFVTRELAKQGI